MVLMEKHKTFGAHVPFFTGLVEDLVLFLSHGDAMRDNGLFSHVFDLR